MYIILLGDVTMTICISAICTENEENNIVFAVDYQELGKYEYDIIKYQCLNENTVGMIAGNALLMDYFLNEDYSEKSYAEIKKSIEEKFRQKRHEEVQKILDVYSIDFDYLRELLKNPITNEYQKSILKSISKAKINAAILLIGFEDGEVKINEIGNFGTEDYTQINFSCIGSASIQAQNTLLFQQHSKNDDLKTTLYNVFKAKKNAEVMQGVGKKTDIGYITKDGIKLLTKEDIDVLNEIYGIELNYGKNNPKLDELKI